MEFSVTTEGFMSGISAAVNASSKDVVKDFEGVDKINLQVDQNGIVVSSFGGRVAVKTLLSDTEIDNLGFVFKSSGQVCSSAVDLFNVLDSFAPTDNLIITLSDNDGTKELLVKLESDEEQYQTLPCFSKLVDLPKKADNFAKVIKIRKSVLMYGLDKVGFAAGIEKEKPQYYMNLVMNTSSDSIRFSAGSGARHAILDIEGDKIFTAKPVKSSVILSKNYMPVVTKALQTVGDGDITISESKKKQQDAPFQILIEADPYEIIIVGVDPSLQWVDESAVLDKDYSIKLITKADDWKYVVKGIAATYNDQVKQERRAHKAEMEVDFANDNIVVKTKEKMRSHRKLPIVDVENVNNESSCDLVCVSAYLSEIALAAKKEDYVQLEMMGKSMPVVVCYHAGEKISERKDMIQESAEGYKERFLVFFGTHAK